MKRSYIVVMSDLSTKEYREALDHGDIGYVDPVLHLPRKPNFIDILYIDQLDIEDKDYKHVLEVMEDHEGNFEVVDYVTCFGRTISNL